MNFGGIRWSFALLAVWVGATGADKTVSGNFEIPSIEVFTQMIVDEIKLQGAMVANAPDSEHAKLKPESVISNVVEKMIHDKEKHGENVTQDELEDTEWVQEMVEKIFESGQELQAFKAVDDALKGIGLPSLCTTPGNPNCKTFDEQRLIQIETWIETRLSPENEIPWEPSTSEFYLQLELDTGIQEGVANELIMSNPKLSQSLTKLFQAFVLNQEKEKVGPVADLIHEALVDALNQHKTLTEAITELSLTNEMAVGILANLDAKELDQITQVSKDADAALQEKVDSCSRRQLIQNHTYFEELINEPGGTRRLRFKSHPDTVSLQDQIEEIHRNRERRRLSRSPLPLDTSDFERRLLNHVEELRGHAVEMHRDADYNARRLKEGDSGSSSRKIANKMAEAVVVTDNLTKIVKQLIAVLDPFQLLLKGLDLAINILDVLMTGSDIAITALTAAMAIPGAVPTAVFGSIRGALTPIHAALKQANTALQLFQSTVGEFWQFSIGKVLEIIKAFESFASPVVRYAAKGADLFADIQNSQCIRTTVQKFSFGVDILGGIEAAADLIVGAIETIGGAVDALLDAFLDAAWTTIEQSLNSFREMLVGLGGIFEPFQPFADALSRGEVILPWYDLPVPQRVYGPAQCDSGYFELLNKCWESNSAQYERAVDILPMMTYTCGSVGMIQRWDGNCEKDSYQWAKRGKDRNCWRECGWFNVCWDKCEDRCPDGWNTGWFDCEENCRDGYSKFFDRCWRNDCPSGFGNLFDVCTKAYRRDQYQRDTNCNNYQLQPGHYWITDWSLNNNCRSCPSGHKPFGDLLCIRESAQIVIKIEEIVEAYVLIADFIDGTDIGKTILDAIEQKVMEVLRDVYNEIKDFADEATGIELPEFPDVSIGLLPFELVEGISQTFPEAPDLSELAKAPLKAFDDAASHLPYPAPSLARCGGDLSCMLSGLGMGSVSDYIDPVSTQFDLVEELKPSIMGMIDKLGCLKWGVMTVPLSDLMSKLGIEGEEVCDFDIDYCEEVDLGPVQEVLEEMNRKFQEPMQRFEKVLAHSGRRLDEANFQEKFVPLLHFGVSPAGLAAGKARSPTSAAKLEYRMAIASPMKMVRAASDWVTDQIDIAPIEMLADAAMGVLDSIDMPVGFHIMADPSVYFKVGMIIQNGASKLGIKIGAKLETRFGGFLGAVPLLVETITIAKRLDKFGERPESKKCKEDDPRYTNACGSIIALESLLAFGPPESCSVAGMTQLLAGMDWPFEQNEDKLDTAIKCISHWFELDAKISVDTLAFSVESSVIENNLDDMGEFFGSIADWDWDSLKDLVQLDMDWIGEIFGFSDPSNVLENNAGGGDSAADTEYAKYPWEGIMDRIKFDVGLSFAGDSKYLSLKPTCSFGATEFKGCRLGGSFQPHILVQELAMGGIDIMVGSAENMVDSVMKGDLDSAVNGVMGGANQVWGNVKEVILTQLNKLNLEAYGAIEYSYIFDPMAILERAKTDLGGRRLTVDTSFAEPPRIVVNQPKPSKEDFASLLSSMNSNGRK